jgi:hypothetical protein
MKIIQKQNSDSPVTKHSNFAAIGIGIPHTLHWLPKDMIMFD